MSLAQGVVAKLMVLIHLACPAFASLDPVERVTLHIPGSSSESCDIDLTQGDLVYRPAGLSTDEEIANSQARVKCLQDRKEREDKCWKAEEELKEAIASLERRTKK